MKPAARVGREFMQECMHNTGDSPNQLTSTRVPKIKNKHETKPANNIPEGAVQRHSYCYDHTHTASRFFKQINTAKQVHFALAWLRPTQGCATPSHRAGYPTTKSRISSAHEPRPLRRSRSTIRGHARYSAFPYEPASSRARSRFLFLPYSPTPTAKVSRTQPRVWAGAWSCQSKLNIRGGRAARRSRFEDGVQSPRPSGGAPSSARRWRPGASAAAALGGASGAIFGEGVK